MDVYGRASLGMVATVDDGNGEVPRILIGNDRRHLLTCLVMGTCEIRRFDEGLTVIESFDTPGFEVPLAFSAVARRAVWNASAVPAAGESSLEDLEIASFGEAAAASLETLRTSFPTAGMYDSNDVHGAFVHDDGGVWIAIAARRLDAVTLHVARVDLEAARVATVVILVVQAGEAWIRDGFGPVRFAAEGTQVIVTVASSDGERDLVRIALAAEGAELRSVMRDDAPTVVTPAIASEILGAIAEAQEQAAELAVALPWEAPQPVVTADGPALLWVGATRAGLTATLWR